MFMRGCLRKRGNETWRRDVPHILMGASSSRRMGWFMKISRALVQRYFISYSCSCTGFPGLFPLTLGADRTVRRPRIWWEASWYSPSNNLSMTESRSISVCASAIATSPHVYFVIFLVYLGVVWSSAGWWDGVVRKSATDDVSGRFCGVSGDRWELWYFM